MVEPYLVLQFTAIFLDNYFATHNVHADNVVVFLNIGCSSCASIAVSFYSIVHDFFLSSNFRKRRVSIPKFNGAMRCCLCVTFQLAKRFGPDRLAGQRLTILHRSSLISRAVTGLGFSIFLDKFA